MNSAESGGESGVTPRSRPMDHRVPSIDEWPRLPQKTPPAMLEAVLALISSTRAQKLEYSRLSKFVPVTDVDLFDLTFDEPEDLPFVALDIEAAAAKVRRIVGEQVVGATYSSLRPHTTTEGGRERKFWSMDIFIPKTSYSDELADNLDDILAQKMRVEEIDMLLTWITPEQ